RLPVVTLSSSAWRNRRRNARIGRRRMEYGSSGLVALALAHTPSAKRGLHGLMMTETRTLEFESPRALQSLYTNDIKLSENLEDSLGVKVTTREGWVKLEGDRSRVDKAQQVFDQLEQARQQGVDIQKHEFNYTLKAVTEERGEPLSDIVSMKIVTSSRKPPVVARSANQ